MRREGFELSISRPRVLMKKDENGQLLEPIEEVVVDVDEEFSGNVVEKLGRRRGELIEMIPSQVGNKVRLIFNAPSRGLIGFSTEFLTATHGYGIANHSFLDFRPVLEDSDFNRKLGVLVSMNNGTCTAYACGQMEDRGELLIEPGTEVYEGMIVGICNKEEDLAVNITREKQMTNQRSATKDSTVVLKRPRLFSLENYLEFIDDDELVEITPKHIRLRKAILDTVERKKFDSIKLKAKKEQKK